MLRVLGNLTDAEGFEYVTSEEVLEEARAQIGEVEAGAYKAKGKAAKANGADNPADEIDTPIYSVDAMVRRANALQHTVAAKRAAGEGDA